VPWPMNDVQARESDVSIHERVRLRAKKGSACMG
jgi:hypothetical protein